MRPSMSALAKTAEPTAPPDTPDKANSRCANIGLSAHGALASRWNVRGAPASPFTGHVASRRSPSEVAVKKAARLAPPVVATMIGEGQALASPSAQPLAFRHALIACDRSICRLGSAAPAPGAPL